VQGQGGPRLIQCAEIKTYNRMCERLLHDVEVLGVLAKIIGSQT